ncbi:MAG: STAS domain-containing protein [Candidatus Krumholzibacteria bacterium]|nr:STAS domain-containing protein [Candidatus Krumholzibacteria bacterium]
MPRTATKRYCFSGAIRGRARAAKAGAMFEARYIDDIAVIDLGERRLVGEQDEYDLWKEIERILGAGAKKIILDLSEIRWTNSTGIGILVSSWTMATREKAELVVVSSSPRLENIFKVTNLSYIMKIFASLDEAVAYLRTFR